MAKFNTLDEYVNTFNPSALKVYKEIQQMMNDIGLNIQEKLFAGQVAFFIEENLKRTFHSSPVIVMSFFHDHVNIFASANIKYKSNLPDYKFSKKGTMQIYYDDSLDKEYLSKLFIESLGNNV